MKKRINYPKEENESYKNEDKSKKEKQKKLKNRNNKKDKNTKNDKIYPKKETMKITKKKGKKFIRKKDNYNKNIKANEEILIITKENQEKPKLEKDIVEIQDKMHKEEKENIMKYIIQYLDQDNKFYLNREEEINKSIKGKKKVTSEEVDENLEEIIYI